MISKTSEKIRAINLRREGVSYGDIIKEVKVSKSTLSLWLRSVSLSARQRQKLTEKKRASALRGALSRKEKRILDSTSIKASAKKEIGRVTKRELFLIGVALYWAEGNKEKEWSPGSGVRFGNSDPKMISLFLRWLEEVCKIPKDMLVFSISIHENRKGDIERAIEFWSKVCGCHRERFRIKLKRWNKKTNRKNKGENYFGLLEVTVRKSSRLLRKIAGWTEGISV